MTVKGTLSLVKKSQPVRSQTCPLWGREYQRRCSTRLEAEEEEGAQSILSMRSYNTFGLYHMQVPVRLRIRWSEHPQHSSRP